MDPLDGDINDLLKSMRKEMVKLKNVMKEKTDKNLDGTFPQLESFDSLKNPLDHITTFKMILNLQQTPNEILCRSFLATLKGAARVWFNKLTRSSIDDFEQLSNAFVQNFVGRQRQKRPVDHLLTIK